MSDEARVPLVGISCNYNEKTEFPSHGMSEKYVTAVIEGTGAVPTLVPALGEAIDVDGLIEHLDGVLLTGGSSNVEPHHYDGPASRDGTEHDPGRDGVALPLVRAALARGVPLFGICRGIQEMNVALGGSLHQHLQEVPGREDHRRQRHRPLPEQFAARHRVYLTPGGYLARLAGAEEARVNSLHGQGIDRLAPGLEVEAVADDGTVEAVRVRDAGTFAVGVQWHAEWRIFEHPLSLALFRAFGDAVWSRARQRAEGVAARPTA